MISLLQIEVRQPTLREQFIQDELELKNQVENMNMRIQNKIKSFSDSKEKYSYICNNRLNKPKSKFNSTSKTNMSSISKFSNLTFQSTQESSNNEFNFDLQNKDAEDEEMISQNIQLEEKIVKCIIIGDKQVGKTLLRNKILEDSSDPSLTKSLEIKKKLIFIGDKAVKLELWDTNTKILNSPIIQSKFIYH